MAPELTVVPKVSTAQATSEATASRNVGNMQPSGVVRLTVPDRSPILHLSGRQRGATLLSQQVR
jgi:hypothetical protein